MTQKLSALLLRFVVLNLGISASWLCAGADALAQASTTARNILPDDAAFNTPPFDDYEALYSSSSSKTGAFTLQARKAGDGKTLTMIDIIPMAGDVIVAARRIDLATHRAEFTSGPYFAWGAEFVVSQSDGERFNWVRVPVGDGEPVQLSGDAAHGGYVSEMFSPTLASLMPMAPGSLFRLPAAYPRKDGSVSVEFDEYRVLRRETLEFEGVQGCECWVIEKNSWSGMTEQIWVARTAPFVYRRVRDVGGPGEFASDLLAFRAIEK